MARADERSGVQTLAATLEQPLVGIVAEEDGQQIVRYSAQDLPGDTATVADGKLRAVLAVIGGWSDLDWDALAEDLDRLRHESPPTPPIEE